MMPKLVNEVLSVKSTQIMRLECQLLILQEEGRSICIGDYQRTTFINKAPLVLHSYKCYSTLEILEREIKGEKPCAPHLLNKSLSRTLFPHH